MVLDCFPGVISNSFSCLPSSRLRSLCRFRVVCSLSSTLTGSETQHHKQKTTGRMAKHFFLC